MTGIRNRLLKARSGVFSSVKRRGGGGVTPEQRIKKPVPQVSNTAIFIIQGGAL